jgi:hypothetical protein
MNSKITHLALFVTAGALLTLGEAALALSGTSKRAERARTVQADGGT